MNRKKIPPNIEWVRDYVCDQGYTIDPDQFYDHHQARDWWLDKKKGLKMKDWQAAVRTWARNDKKWNPTGNENKLEWHQTAQGIIDMGIAHGISEDQYPHFPAFKSAVLEAFRRKEEARQAPLKLVGGSR